jgi:hypothetical protein
VTLTPEDLLEDAIELCQEFFGHGDIVFALESVKRETMTRGLEEEGKSEGG